MQRLAWRNPAAEALLARELQNAVAGAVDAEFIKALSAAVSPAEASSGGCKSDGHGGADDYCAGLAHNSRAAAQDFDQARRHVRTLIRERPEAVTIAEESTAWPRVTAQPGMTIWRRWWLRVWFERTWWVPSG